MMTLLGSTGCGDDEKCPRGTTGNPCRFDSDVGLAPTSPPWVNDVSLDVETQTPDIGPETDGTSESRSGAFGEDSRSLAAWLDQCALEHPSWAAWSDQASREHHPNETPNAHDAHIEAGPGFRSPARTRADTRPPRVSLVIASSKVAPDERQSSGG